MPKKISVAILGSTGYVGLELVKILSQHPNVNIVFLNCNASEKILSVGPINTNWRGSLNQAIKGEIFKACPLLIAKYIFDG